MPRKPTGKPNGRPLKEFNKKTFVDLVGMGCTQQEICWFFRDETGKPANVDTLSRWCQREFGATFQEYAKENRAIALKIQLRKNQLELSKKSAAMGIWLGKQYLDQRDEVAIDHGNNELMESLTQLVRKQMDDD